MQKLTLDADTVAKLNGASQQVELFDEHGNLLALLTPVGTFPPKFWPFTEQELDDARKQTGPTMTLDDIIKKAGLA
jgi:hypothetical protein